MSGLSFSSSYELLELAGQGGMATVWRGVVRGAAGFVRPVAIKRILSDLLDNPDSLQMFIEEARVGSQLHHPNIVQIIDFGRDDQGNYFLVMEWIDGLDLRRYLTAWEEVFCKPLPWPLAAAITVEALRGLDAAHQRIDEKGRMAPVYHRDVTPQNILVGLNGVVKLTDFGLARAMDRARMTHPDIVKGKLGYLAPELSYGAEPSVRSDLFSVGVVLWEALAGKRLYEGENDVEVFLAARKAEVPSLESLRADVPQGLARTVSRVLSREPAERFGSAREMLLELTRLLRTLPQPTDAPVVAQSAIDASRALARLKLRAAHDPHAQSPAKPAVPPRPRSADS